MKFFQSIRFKLTLLMVMLLVVPITIIGIISYQNTNILEHAVIDKPELEEFSDEFQQIFSEHQELIQDLSTSPELQLKTFNFPNKAENSISNLPTVNDTVKEEFYQTYLSDFESSHEYLLNTYLATDEGEFYLSNIPPAEVDLQEYDPRQTDWYIQAEEANGDTIWTAPYVDTGTGKSTITLAKAMTDSSGQIIGIVGFDFDMHLLAVQIREGIRNSTILIAIISVILGVGLISLFVTRFNRTITSIKNKMEIVADGDLSVEPLQTNRKDELGVLTNSFNQMVNKLKTIVKQVIDTSQQVSSAAAQLTVNADETSKASEQIAGSIQDVASGAEEQLEKVRQSNKVFDSISESISDISTRSEKVAQSSLDMSDKALIGSEIIGSAIEQMTNITTNTGHTTKVISELNKKSEEIEEIITLINGIAEQTNLLSLNAAIEAARAGEHGKGFAVVADEVRKLAEQSSNSTKRISQIVKEIQSNTHIAVDSMNQGTISVDKGAELVEEARTSFSGITTAVNEVTNRMSEVTKSIDEIQGNTVSLAESVKNVSNITEQTTGYTQEVAASTEEQTASMQEVNAATIMLADLALELQDVASQFKI